MYSDNICLHKLRVRSPRKYLYIFKYTPVVKGSPFPIYNMLLCQILALTLALAPSLASAAIFPKDTRVKMLDTRGFKRVMKKNVHFYSSLSVARIDGKTVRKQVWSRSLRLGVVYDSRFLTIETYFMTNF